MTKKLFSMLLVLSMILTMLPIGVMAEEVDSAVGEKGEIIAFAPLKETEKKVHQGTSLEGLDLPETLSAKVKLSMPEDAVSDKVYGPEKGETFVDIPVTWISQPKYQMNTEGVYVFIPVIEGYTLAEEVKLPQIAVIVETDALMVKMAGPMAAAQAQWGTGTEDTVPDTWESGKLSDAISYANALTSGTAYIQLLQNVTLSAPLIIEGNQDIVLDLNDKTLDGDVQYAIQHNGSGTLTITGSGKITSKNVGNWGTICLTGEGSSLDVKSGIVENTATGWELNCTIHASRASNVSVSGGTIYSGGRAIDFASHDGSVYISAGTLKGRIAIDSSTYNNNQMISGGLLEGTDAAISSRGSGGNIVISGSAEVKSTNGNAISIKTGRNITITDTAKVESINGCAIDSSGKVKITISGTAKVTSGNNNLAQGTIYPYNLSDGAVVEIQGGTIENTAGGNAVYIPYKAQLIIKEDCDAVIKGGNMAINKAPDLSGYIYARILGSTTSADGTGAADILLEDIDTDEKVQAYKYLQFEPGPYVARIGGTTYTDLQDAMDAVGENETIILLKDISGNFTITKINPFTLDLNGKTLDGGSYAAITHQGSGILTVADRIGSGKITSTTNINGTIYLIVGSLEVKGGTVENSASGDTRAVYNLGIGSVKVSGGTVISYGSEALSAAIYNFHLGDVYVF
ncbi:MAG TPA: hypothetical protein GX503_08300, partial [Clostridiales bacterium]|nr:hypothetical protein [Clostridiales bacterium]